MWETMERIATASMIPWKSARIAFQIFVTALKRYTKPMETMIQSVRSR